MVLTGRVSKIWASIQSTIPCTTGIIFGLTTSPVFAIVAILWEIHVGGHICHTNSKIDNELLA
ncbi:uncharacterized protein BN745_04857 [Klebsiella variicola CAG:634]|nr:uncharacterized protein BN745_04857 [Klebsiella variicola CAG:634]